MTEPVKEISDEELSSLTTAIKTRFGIDFTNYEPKSLKRGFARLIMRKQLGSVLGLWSKIMKDREFIMGCIDELTVNLTELFRNPEIWNKIKDDVLEHYKTKLNLNIWHAGCSSGEEVYTMAFVLQNKGMLRRTKALATDLSHSILAEAINGEYSPFLLQKYSKSMNEYMPGAKLEDYFIVRDNKCIVKDDFRKHIEFRQHNLVQDGMDRVFDIIFCRNVMIYFDDNLKMKVIKLFHSSLADNGFFIIGYYDMMPDGYKEFFELYDAKTRIYRKIKK